MKPECISLRVLRRLDERYVPQMVSGRRFEPIIDLSQDEVVVRPKVDKEVK